ncbi:SAM-dependent methyltransferase [Streptomyces gamaensis]|uniref:SAM-dependent methyltransferase n=1 Tax=Streptomyces gamaensis TaxID=1763542 RepID=A0ABW0YSG3_9ACTN
MTGGAPAAEGIGELYDRLTDLMAHAMGGYLHGGYWAGPDPATTVEEAGDRLTDVVAAGLDLRPGSRLLDVGCGNGKAGLRVAAAHGAHVTGITLSPYQAGLARERAAAAGMAASARFEVADMHDLPFAEASFDAVLAIEVMCHAPVRTRVYEQLARVLRPGGTVAVTDFVLRRPVLDPGRRAAVEHSEGDFQHGPILPRAAYEECVTAAGLDVVDFTDIGEAVRPSFEAVAAAMRAARQVVQTGMAEADFHRMVDGIARFGSVTEIGYAVVTARKPS